MRVVCSFVALISPAFIMAATPVRVWQGTLTLPTYEEGAPDPNPPFDQFATVRLNYPYTLREQITDHPVDHAWRAVYLENEYLKCSVLPDLGGHLYTCLDKTSGQPMFYANPSIKKASIGYRGAWAAFGIEFNFPVSHNWVSMSPVDFAFRAHDDGAASVTVGNTDRVYGMQWSVELILRPGSTVLEQRVTLNNRSDARHRFYWWNNAAVEVWDDSKIEYPMRFAASHGFTEVQPWPVDTAGKDLSVIRNQTDGPVSLFAHGSREAWMGIWNPRTSTGVAHYADYSELPAKKIWSWGVDADGLDWRKALSDNNSAYVEVQAGLFRNQETYAFLPPRQAIAFSEFWMPVRGTGGIARANLNGVVNFTRGEVLLNVNRELAGARVRILDGDRTVSEKQEDLSPARTWRVTRPACAQAGCALTVELTDSAGQVLLRHKEGEYDWTPLEEIHAGPQPSQTPVGPLEVGEDHELNGRLLDAFQTYTDALQRAPEDLSLRKAAGRLAAGLFRFDEGIQHLELVLQRNTTDAEAAYYLGLAYEGLGRVTDARSSFETAYRLPTFRGAAALHLGELCARSGDSARARAFLDEAHRLLPDDPGAAEEWIALRHAGGDSTDVDARELLRRFPLSGVLRKECGSGDVDRFFADADRLIDAATVYLRLGIWDQAITLLSRPNSVTSPDQTEPGVPPPGQHAMVAYYRAFAKLRSGADASRDFAAASALPVNYVFPNGPYTEEVLRAAIQAKPHDATAHFLLGTFLFSRGLTNPALAEWEVARKDNARIPTLHASMGLALLRVKHDAAAAVPVLEEGLDADSRNAAIYRGIDDALSILNRPAAERVKALERYPDPANMPTDLAFELALNRAEAGDYRGAEALFRGRFFAREEGGTNVRQVWTEVRLQEAQAAAAAGRCADAEAIAREIGQPEAGLSFTRDGMKPFVSNARTQYLLAALFARCGNSNESAKRTQDALGARDAAQLPWAYAAAKLSGSESTPEWRNRLLTALEHAQANAKTSAFTSYWIYTTGALEAALGDTAAAAEAFQHALLLPDRNLAHHLSRLALAKLTPK